MFKAQADKAARLPPTKFEPEYVTASYQPPQIQTSLNKLPGADPRVSWQPSPKYDMFEIQDLKRDDASQDDIIGIEECYEETTFEERK